VKRCWFCVLAAGIFVSALAGARQPSNDSSNALYFENGTIANSIYSNECLGFSLPIPAGWNLNTQIGSSSDGKARHRPNHALALLVLDQPEQDASGTRIRIFLEARDASAQRDTAQEYVSKIAHAHSYPQDRILIRDAFALAYGGRQFFRADYKETHANIGTLYFASVFTKFRQHLIGGSLTARSPEELDQAADSLLGISFQDDRINTKCAMGSEAESSNAMHGPVPIPNAPGPRSALPLRVRISSSVAQGLVIKKVAPNYPSDARQARIQGSVVLQAEIDTNGDVADLALVSGHPALAPAAITAVKQWKYKPYLLNGQPVTVETQIVVNFALSGH
jgi:TonB family protein